MQRYPFRTSATDLSQDELRLLDVLFNCAATLSSLRRECFRATWNQPTHNLDDAELQLTVGRLCDRGILVAQCHGDNDYVRLSENGGKLWSLERCPIWETYATERYGETISGKLFVTSVTTSPSTRDDFLRLGGPGATWQFDDARVRRFEIEKHTLIPWRRFPRLFVAVVMNIADDYPIDPVAHLQKLVALEQLRTWWRNVFELQKFLPPST